MRRRAVLTARRGRCVVARRGITTASLPGGAGPMRAKDFFRRAEALGGAGGGGMAMGGEVYNNDRAKLVATLPQLTGKEVYANVDLSLEYINVYGFDLDFSLAPYITAKLSRFIYEEARAQLVRGGYPNDLARVAEFDPYWAVRGLFFDTLRGTLMKIGQFGSVVPSCVVRGKQPVPPEEVLEMYPSFRVSREYLNENCYMYKDLFAQSEMALISDCMELFRGHDVDPAHVFADVRAAIGHVHSSGLLYREVMRSPETYLGEGNDELARFLVRLRDAGKRTFLLTNSPPFYADAVMRHLTQSGSWAGELFDVVACSARKPSFYKPGARPFRRLDSSGNLSLEPVSRFERGSIYAQGSMDAMLDMAGFRNDHSIYFGDQIQADLVEPSRRSMRTAAIVSELRHEVSAQGHPDYRRNLGLLLELNELIMAGQEVGDPAVAEAVVALKVRRTKARRLLKEIVNPTFGSVFRTDQGRTMFFHHVGRHADIYTSDVLNLSQYSLDHCFYSERSFLPHEVALPSSEVMSLLTDLYATRHVAECGGGAKAAGE